MNKNLLSIPKLIIRLSCFQFVKRKLVKYLQVILDIFPNGVSTPLVIVVVLVCWEVLYFNGNVT